MIALALAACAFHAARALPDRACTPGATNPAVTQQTLSTTICKPGWTATVRPPLSVTEPEKYRLMRAYGLPKGTSARGYELDHLVPLELGGATDGSENLWPQSHASSYRKDKLENRAHREVCAGRVTLAVAQHWFETDWRTVQ